MSPSSTMALNPIYAIDFKVWFSHLTSVLNLGLKFPITQLSLSLGV